MTNIARYTNGHLFDLYGERLPIMEKIAKALGGLSDEDFESFEAFAARIQDLGAVACESNCQLYVDAE